jgi:cysteinyl-tRNA synthetase
MGDDMIKMYNSLTRQKEQFKPLVPGKISLYVCGITVYDHCHLGHARSMICFDVIVRFFQAMQYDVTFVKNITDIDDKIIVRAHERGVAIDVLTEEYIRSMHQDMDALNCLSPTIEPRATTSIEAITHLIQRLIDAKMAYLSDDGDVCYEVNCFKAYGKLSNKDLDGLMSGARVEVAEGKRSPLDFVLWKRVKPNEPSWDSPWGAGRPGWHIECSAMAMDALGEQFDIHGGGLDLQFPHHENEIAQSEGATHKTYANYWLHVGMLQLNNEKMSKSTGNFLTIQDALKQHHTEVIRYFLLSSHYRSPLNYSEDTVTLAQKALTRLYQSIRDFKSSSSEVDTHWVESFNRAMADDFNTPIALSVLFDLSHEINKTRDEKLGATLKHLANMLGLLNENPDTFLQAGVSEEKSTEIERLVQARWDARMARQWAQADEIRAQLLAQGIEVEDGVAGSTWRRL